MINFNQEQQYSLCVKCGKCRSVCPVFQELNEEGAAPRGKVALIQALLTRNLSPSSRSKNLLSECLLCTACVEVCPNNVRTDLLIMSTRERLINYPDNRMIESTLTNVFISRIDLSFKLGYIVEHTLGRKVESETDLFYRLPANHMVPEIKERFSRSKKNTYTMETKTGFFLGCLIDFISHDVAEDAITLLKLTGITPYIPEEQSCCGLPALSIGNTKRAKKQAMATITLFKNVDTVVTACGSCGSMMKNYYKLLFDTPEDIEQADQFARKIKDITEVLPPDMFDASTFDKIITYHDSCHLKRGMGISETPRILLKKAGHKIVEMKTPDKCCGLGGSFNIKHHKLSIAITKQKVDDIYSTNAEVVATGCPGCMANISEMLFLDKSNVKVMHTVNLLAMSIAKNRHNKHT